MICSFFVAETEEAEAAFLFNEMEDRFHAANQDSLSRSPAASRNSSAHPDILRRPSYNPHSSGISRSQPSVPTSDAVRRRLPRISLLDDSPREDHRDILNRLRMPGGLSDADYPSDERRLEGRSRWTDDNVEAEDTLRPVPSRRDQFWHAPSEPSSRRHHVHSSSSNGDSDSLLRPMRFSRDVAQVRDTPEHHLSMNIPDRRGKFRSVKRLSILSLSMFECRFSLASRLPCIIYCIHVALAPSHRSYASRNSCTH